MTRETHTYTKSAGTLKPLIVITIGHNSRSKKKPASLFLNKKKKNKEIWEKTTATTVFDNMTPFFFLYFFLSLAYSLTGLNDIPGACRHSVYLCCFGCRHRLFTCTHRGEIPPFIINKKSLGRTRLQYSPWCIYLMFREKTRFFKIFCRLNCARVPSYSYIYIDTHRYM